MAKSRLHYDAKTKDRIVSLIKSKKVSIPEVCKEYKCQPYQVLAWIGERALRDGDAPMAALPRVAPATAATPFVAAPLPNTADTSLMEALTSTDFAATMDPTLAQAIGEWWLRVRLPQELAAKTDTPSGGGGQGGQ